MKLQKLIAKQFRHQGDGVNVAGDVNAVVSANVVEGTPSTNAVSRPTRTHVVQRGGKSEVATEKEDAHEQ